MARNGYQRLEDMEAALRVVQPAKVAQLEAKVAEVENKLGEQDERLKVLEPPKP